MTASDLSWFPTLSPRLADGGARFRAVSRSASSLRLLLYDSPRDPLPAREIALDPERDRRGDVWELFVPGVRPGQAYLWKCEGARGIAGPLLDPFALAYSGPERFGCDDPARQLAPRPPRALVNAGAAWKSLVVDPPPPPGWNRPRTPLSDTLLYELHVRGFTRGAKSGVSAPGTYRGLAEKVPYLKELGITAVELLPVHEFDETEMRPRGAELGTPLVNVWGYSPIGWFSPNRRYAAAAAEPLGPIAEFREMVAAFHAAGIEVILDVVFNHTAEMDETGTPWHFRGFDDDLFYLKQGGRYANHSGCGNTVQAHPPAVRLVVLEALRWWMHGMGVDGFRFDLASILCRDGEGRILAHPPLLREIEEDPWLSGAKIIAEPWDAGGGYLVGRWPGGPRWSVWNDRFRDDTRRAWLLEPRLAGVLASRLSGSSDLFPEAGPLRGINFVTSHDGFTLADTVSYSRRHNRANGEEGRDGNGSEPSWNHGVEGPAASPAIRAAREVARRNLAATLLLSQGVPMLLAGDEFGRSQAGNNNAYCHDGELSWVDWRGRESDAPFHRFLSGLVRLRRRHASLRRPGFLAGADHDGDGVPDVAWFGPSGQGMRWEEERGLFAFRLSGARGETGAAADEPDLCLLVNLLPDAREFLLPPDREGRIAWRILVETAALPPADLHDPLSAPPAPPRFPLPPRSLALLGSC
jgi:glycogen operon protein